MSITHALLVWMIFAVVAIANGGLREAVLVRAFGDRLAHVLSTLILASCILGITAALLPWLNVQTTRQAWMMGGLWLSLTILFEFLAGHFLFRVPWSKLFADYNVGRGRIWILVLVVTLTAPLVALSLRGM